MFSHVFPCCRFDEWSIGIKTLRMRSWTRSWSWSNWIIRSSNTSSVPLKYDHRPYIHLARVPPNWHIFSNIWMVHCCLITSTIPTQSSSKVFPLPFYDTTWPNWLLRSPICTPNRSLTVTSHLRTSSSIHLITFICLILVQPKTLKQRTRWRSVTYVLSFPRHS